MFMFGDFKEDYKKILKVIDDLIVDYKYDTFTNLENLTMRELNNIVNTRINKQEKEKMQQNGVASDLASASKTGYSPGID